MPVVNFTEDGLVYNINIISNSYFWRYHGKRHRERGPATILSNGEKRWYHMGKLHREDGPAIICPGGIQHWYLNSELLSKQEFLNKQKGKIIKIKDELYLKDGRKIKGLI